MEEKENVKKIIEGLDVAKEKKNSLLNKLETEGVTDSLMDEIKACLNEMEDKLYADMPEMQELEKAASDLSNELDAVDKEAAALGKKLGKELDKIDMEDTRGALDTQ